MRILPLRVGLRIVQGRASVFLLTVLLVCLALGAGWARALFSNPQVPQGGSASFPSSGTLSPASGLTWDIIDSSSATIATSSVPAGWTVSLSGVTFTVGAPAAATVETNYTVRYNTLVAPSAVHGRAAGAGWAPPAPSQKSRAPVLSYKSAVFDVVAGATAPTAPSNLTATAISGTQIALAWTDNSTNETNFLVERKTGSGGTYAQIASVPANTVSYADSGLTASTTYYYRVRAANVAGDSTYSNEANATTPALNPPAAPSNLIAATLNSYQVGLSWTDNSNNETGFKIERLGSDGITWGQIATTGANVTAYTNSGLSPNTTYSYRVRATNAGGDSAYSNVLSATTPNGPPVPPGTFGTDFWLAFPPSGAVTGTMHSLTVMISSPTAASGTVTPASTGTAVPFSIPSGGGSTEVPIAYTQQINMVDGIVTAGIHVVSDNAVTVNALNSQSAASEGFTALSTPALGTNYIHLSYPTDLTAGIVGPFYSQLVVLATQAGTTITVTPSCTTGTRTSGVPYTITLGAGQAYALQAVEHQNDLTGSTVTSNYPVVVYAGTEGAFVPVAVSAANPLIEQEPSVDRWGTDFYAVPYATRTAGDVLKVLSSRIGTHVYADGTLVSTLDQGAVATLALSAASHITSDKPILVAQISKGCQTDNNANADPFMTVLPPSTGYAATSIVAISDNDLYTASYINVVAPTSAVGDVTLDGAVIPPSEFAVIGSSSYSKASISVNSGGHLVTTATTGAPVFASGYGFGTADGYGYPGSSTLPQNTFSWTLPASPTTLTAAAVSTSQINLSWVNVATGSSGVEIDMLAPSGSWSKVTTVSATTTTYQVTGLTKATQYSFRVRAYTDLYSPYSNIATATTWDTPPSAPTGLTANTQSQSQINLSWADTSSNETGFKIERLGSDGVTWTQIGTTAANVSTYSDTGLTKLTTYSYRVKATNAFGDSAYSNTASATTFDSPPTAPSGLTATAISTSQINLQWADNSNNEQGFYVERSPGTGGGAWTQIATVAANATTYADAGLMDATTYSYRVRAYDNGGTSAYSNIATTATLTPPIPSAPTVLTATAISSSQIQLAWTDNASNEDGFILQRIGGGSSTWTTIASLAPNTTSYTDNGLTAQTTYTYQVCAFNGGGNSSWSNQAAATTPTVPVVSAPQIIVTATGSNRMAVYWKGVSGATGYNVYRATAASGPFMRLTFQPVNPVNPGPGLTNALRYSDLTVSSGTEFFYYVKPVVDALGDEGPASNTESDVPSSYAIPWDSDNASMIISQANSIGSSNNSQWSTSGYTMAMGPDGVLYSQHLDGTLPSSAANPAVVSDSGTVVLDADGHSYAAMGGDELDPDSGPVSGESGYPSTKPGTGIFRKVQANFGHYQFHGIAMLPPDSGCTNLQYDGPNEDTAYIYTGGETNASVAGFDLALDIGLGKGSSSVQGWSVNFLESVNGKHISNPLEAKDPKMSMDDASKFRFSGAVDMTLTLPHAGSNVANNTGYFSIKPCPGSAMFIPSQPGQAMPPSLNFVINLVKFKQTTSNGFHFKRVNAIAQNFVAYTDKQGISHSPPAANARGNDPYKGFRTTGATVNGGGWSVGGDVAVWIDGQEMDTSLTWKAGSYPFDTRFVSYLVTNPWFNESEIMLTTGTTP